MRFITLGTSCAQQTRSRMQSAYALQLAPSVVYLFDCGASTASALIQADIKNNAIQKIFITHLHTDHVIGLPGLLTDICGGHGGNIKDIEAGAVRDTKTNRRIVDVYGPRGIKELVRTTLKLTYTMLASGFRVHELLSTERPEGHIDEPFPKEEGSRDVVSQTGSWSDISIQDDCRVSAVSIQHSVPSLGYIVKEDDHVRLDSAQVQQLQAAYGQQSDEYVHNVKRLKRGETVSLEDDTKLVPTTEKGRQVIILGDTCDASPVLEHVTPPVSLVLHESTNVFIPGMAKGDETLESVRERAISRGHSTPEMAGEFARKCGSEILVLSHFSSRYSGADVPGATRVMSAFESIAKLASTATPESIEAALTNVSRKGRALGTKPGQFQGLVRAAWDGMHIDIPKPGTVKKVLS